MCFQLVVPNYFLRPLQKSKFTEHVRSGKNVWGGRYALVRRVNKRRLETQCFSLSFADMVKRNPAAHSIFDKSALMQVIRETNVKEIHRDKLWSVLT